MKRLIFLSCIFILLLFVGLSVKVNAIEYEVNTTNQADALLITYMRSDTYAHNKIINLSDYSIEFRTSDVTIYERGTLLYNFSYEYDFLTLYLQYTRQRYDIIFFETSYFSRVDNTTRELYRDYLTTQSDVPEIEIFSDSNFKSIIELSGQFYDTVEYVNSILSAEYINTFNNFENHYYNKGYNQGYYNGSGINKDDYIEKDNALGWVFALFDAFSAFFALKLGPVSIGAIVIVPLAISLVWFILRMLRGGGSS